jgi:hypothetical protein
MLRKTILIAAMLGAMTAPAMAQGPEADARATPPAVHQVLSGGYWSDGKVDGFYRIVVTAGGFDHISYRLFIQWMGTDPDSHEAKIARTVAVNEISELSGTITGIRPQFAPNSPLNFTVMLTGRDGKKSQRTVTATPNGRYTIR